ncbi:MAG: hypothetical protein K0S24_173 [Sphingobacterium sp.]|nr:hypothetical protein [Sphingobacterium sp.]
MNRKMHELILLIWLLSTVYLIFGAMLFNRASFMGIALISQSQLSLLLIILLTATYIFPKNWERKRWLLIAVEIVVLNLFCVLMRYIIEEIIFVKYLGFPKTEDLNPLFFVYDNFYYSLPGFFIGFITFLIFRTHAIEKRNTELRTSVKEAELNLLKSQINPHFLYNVLNYMYSMALPLSEKLSTVIAKLAGTMRYTLNKLDVQLTPLQEEIEFIQDYIDLQSTQFDQGIYCTFIQDVQNDKMPFPTLILITFIENAFKHGIVDDPASPVKIWLKAENNLVEFEVENRIHHKLKADFRGIGLANIKRRLAILFPDRHTLHILHEGDVYSIHLRLYN